MSEQKIPKIKIDTDSRYMHTASVDVPTDILIKRFRHIGTELIKGKLWDDHSEILLAVVERMERLNEQLKERDATIAEFRQSYPHIGQMIRTRRLYVKWLKPMEESDNE